MNKFTIKGNNIRTKNSLISVEKFNRSKVTFAIEDRGPFNSISTIITSPFVIRAILTHNNNYIQ